MADVAYAGGPPSGNPLGSIPGLKQLLLLGGLAGAIALALWLVVWSQGEDWTPIYTQLSERETGPVADALTAAAVPHKVDPATGQILVPQAQLREARMKLASQGLPESDALGIEMIQKESPFGTSQFMEGARYQLALETELARTITKVQGVSGARVHLAMPRQTAFVRDQKKTSASVMLQLYPGRRLERGQVGAIIHLVASSVPELEAGDVTVVDQAGSLLSEADDDDEMSTSTKQLEFTRNVEAEIKRRAEAILLPLVGPGRVQAAATAKLDFTIQESTAQDFDPNQSVVRSEQTALDQRTGGAGAEGVPGALTNQPPGTTPIPPAGAAGAPGANVQNANGTPPVQTLSQRSTKNNEIDQIITHKRTPAGTLMRLSLAVIIDNKSVVGKDGKTTQQPLTPQELERYTALVRDAVGFDEQRGDRVQVINASFSPVAPDDGVVEEEPIWQQPWATSLAKTGLAAVLVLLVAFLVLRPVMKGLFPPAGKGGARVAGPTGAPGGAGLADGMTGDRVTLSAGGVPAQAVNYEQQVAAARNMVGQDPKKAALVVKEWVAADG